MFYPTVVHCTATQGMQANIIINDEIVYWFLGESKHIGDNTHRFTCYPTVLPVATKYTPHWLRNSHALADLNRHLGVLWFPLYSPILVIVPNPWKLVTAKWWPRRQVCCLFGYNTRHRPQHICLPPSLGGSRNPTEKEGWLPQHGDFVSRLSLSFCLWIFAAHLIFTRMWGIFNKHDFASKKAESWGFWKEAL